MDLLVAIAAVAVICWMLGNILQAVVKLLLLGLVIIIWLATSLRKEWYKHKAGTPWYK